MGTPIKKMQMKNNYFLLIQVAIDRKKKDLENMMEILDKRQHDLSDTELGK